MNDKIYPFLFIPVYKDYFWGGNRFKKYFNRKTSNKVLAESWEISDRNEGMSIVENGFFSGKSLKEIILQYPSEIVGKNFKGSSFPLLIKIIDAKERLSLQVHPDDLSAKKYGGEPKNELWHFLENDNSSIFYGLKNKIDKEHFLKNLQSNCIEDVLNKYSIKKDCNVLVPGGCIHAINSGSLILEIQQNSNTTYRIHDWNRLDINGNPRELHINKALEVINYNSIDQPLLKTKIIKNNNLYTLIEIINGPYFKVEQINLKKYLLEEYDDSTFHALFVANGFVKIEWDENKSIEIKKGRSVLIPASLKKYKMIGQGKIIRTSV